MLRRPVRHVNIRRFGIMHPHDLTKSTTYRGGTRL